MIDAHHTGCHFRLHPKMSNPVAKRKTIADHAADILRETNNPAVMWGDCGLLDMIHERAGMVEKPVGGRTWCTALERHKRVLNALERSPLFKKTVVSMKRGHRGNQCCRVFTLIKEQARG